MYTVLFNTGFRFMELMLALLSLVGTGQNISSLGKIVSTINAERPLYGAGASIKWEGIK